MKPDSLQTFGDYLLSLRQKLDLTSREVAEKSMKLSPHNKHAHISHSYLAMVEKNKFKPPPSKIRSLAMIYGENYEFLLFRAGCLDRNPFKDIERMDEDALWAHFLNYMALRLKKRLLNKDEKDTLKIMVENMLVTMTGK